MFLYYFMYTQQFKIMFKIIPLPEEHEEGLVSPQTSAFKYIKGPFIYSKVLGSDLLLGLGRQMNCFYWDYQWRGSYG